MIERSHLEILREVERQGSLTAAAESLHLTQSALSHAVKKLELQLGTSVWERDGRQLRLTQAGQYLLSLASRLLPQFEHAEMLIGQFAKGQRGTLRIGMECHPCYQWLLKVVGPYLEQWPTVDVDVKQRFQFGGIGALFGHDIDMLVTPDPLHRPGLVFEPVFDYEQVLVVAAGHELAARPWADPVDLADETLITYPVEVERLDIFTQFLDPAGVTPREVRTAELTIMMMQLVASGRGVCSLPNWAMTEYLERDYVKAVTLGETGVWSTLFAAIREDTREAPWMVDFLRTARETSFAVLEGIKPA